MIQFPIFPQERTMLILVASGMVSCDGKWKKFNFPLWFNSDNCHAI